MASRSRVFRVIYDTVLEIEGATEEEIYLILCRNLRRICDADRCALASYDALNKTIALQAIATREGTESIASIPRQLDRGFELECAKSNVRECQEVDDRFCLGNFFPDLMTSVDNPHRSVVSFVREGELLAVGQIELGQECRLKMKDLIDAYINMSGMVIQRVNAQKALKVLNDELAQRVAEQTKELRLTNVRLNEEVSERRHAQEELTHSYGRLQKMFEQSIYGLASALEIRDPYTAGHQRRMAALAKELGRALDLPEERLEGLYMAAIVHDIGKISVPSEILSKPGKLLQEEFSLIKTHSRAGFTILETIEFPWPIAKIVLQHHERCDGTGYPDGLKGSEILLEAKILSIADVFEAMVSHRPYRPGLGAEKAISVISESSGSHFEPQVVEAFLKLYRDGKINDCLGL